MNISPVTPIKQFPSAERIKKRGESMSKNIPNYGKTEINGISYYRTRISLPDGSRKTLYAETRSALYSKEQEHRRQIAIEQIAADCPTVSEYCDKWLKIQSSRVRSTTLVDYKAKTRIYIVEPLGSKLMQDVTADDVKVALVPAAEKSKSTYQKVHMLFTAIFQSAEASNVIAKSPCMHIPANGGTPPKKKEALTDTQISNLLNTVRGLPPYTFVMIGLYAGLRREEILGLMWDCVHLDTGTPYISVQRAWRAEHNRPVISDILKTDTAYRDVTIPYKLAECLRAAKETTSSPYVICNSDGNPVTYTQFKRIWAYITTRTASPRTYTRYNKDGSKEVHTVTPVLGAAAKHNTHVVYSLDFKCTPHILRHTYATNLIAKGVDPKVVQYLLGHKSSHMTMDVYAKVKYNRPEQLYSVINAAFDDKDNSDDYEENDI